MLNPETDRTPLVQGAFEKNRMPLRKEGELSPWGKEARWVDDGRWVDCLRLLRRCYHVARNTGYPLPTGLVSW